MPVSLEREDRVALLIIDNPPVNAASQAVRAGLVERLAQANADETIRAVVLACRGQTFVAGADIKEFGQPPQEPFLPDVVQAIEDSDKPVVAALHGTALGGGFELALAAHARVADRAAQLGLPEVKLGIVPGAGGTQRLPRLAGVPAAVELVSSGRRIGAAEALKLGAIDRIAESDVVAEAVAFAREIANKPPRRTGRLPVPPFDAGTVEAQVAAVEKKARGQKSLGAAARLVRLAADLPLQEGLAKERGKFLELVGSDQAKALRHVFSAERLAAKVPGLEGVAPRPVRQVGVVGAGLMGAGIAVALADAGFSVTVVERDEASVEAGHGRIAALYDRAEKSGRIDAAEKAARMGRLALAAERAALASCDLVIEAVFDDLDVKRELFSALSGILRPDAIIATNTSYLDVHALAEALENPGRFLGLHFFSPANVMRLVEVVRTKDVAPDVLAAGLSVVKRLGKLGVVCGVTEGFIGNRMFSAYRGECDFMLEEGALPHEVDAALEAFGFPMGSYAVTDLAGLEISWARRKRQGATRDPTDRYVVVADRLCEAGRFGQKAGKGYYRYADGRREVDPEVTTLIEHASREKGIERRSFGTDEIVACVSEAMVAEGRKLLDEGIALRASDIDLVMINGYGYPAWRGGPMYAAGVV
ncbi:MAG TPA: 3-hydroxyacyl-CoA dehydrogenase NAD-binding domain-containing protein [Mesorhizobium sp.]|jgi:3-hydroxyacyl-CoA dehydrogenase|nr:3-hydroxyacyl-CoA dehydrogenase NAD-binding domain-containing protein [Mesorhizobium sp.]